MPAKTDDPKNWMVMVRLKSSRKAVYQEAMRMRGCATISEFLRKLAEEAADEVVGGTVYDDRAF